MSGGGEAHIAATIFALLDARAAGGSICPSDVARALERDEDRWRALVPAVRDVARRLAREGRLRVTQRDQDLSLEPVWRGPIRLRRP